MAISYRFGEVEVRPAERQLLVGGQAAAVGARAFDVLMALIDHRDRVVTKNELLDLCWPGLVVEENNLQVQVSTLRKLLGAQSVATIPGRGYRFTLPLDGAEAEPAPATVAARRDNLPAPLSSFVGREGEIAEVRKLLGAARLVTLTSVGGTGKTRLSLKVAGQVLDEFPDGVWFVELAPLADESRVPMAIAAVLGVTEEAGRPVLEALVKSVRDKSMLIVLDNCEHLLRASAEAAKQLLLAGPRVRILASSREALHVTGEATFHVPALATPQAIQLFVDRAQAAHSGFAVTPGNAGAVVEICRRLDGIPLAIELAAARVRTLSVDNIATRLDDCFRLLTGGDQTAMPRQQTLRASIDWSHDLLSAGERVVLRRLAVFAGGWTLEAAESVCAGGEVDGPGVIDLLGNLVEKSLVAVDALGERYHLLETVRQYAIERLEESGEAAAVRDRHLAFYLALAEKARPELVGPRQAAWLARLDQERENLLSAHSWCGSTAGGEETGLRLVSTIKNYWLNRGLLGLAYNVMAEALARAPARSASRCRTLFEAGQVGYFMGRYPEARRHLEESIAIERELGERAITGRALQPLGMACLGLGDLRAARAHLEEGVVRARELGEPRNVAAAVNAMAQLNRVEGNLDAAIPMLEQFVEIARGLEDRESIAIGLLNLAMTAVERGNSPRARELLAEALAIAEATGSKPVGQSVLEVCAGLAAMGSEWEGAARFYGTAEAQAAQTGIHRDPADEAFLAPWVARSRETLGDAAFGKREDEGRALAYETGLRAAREWLTDRPRRS